MQKNTLALSVYDFDDTLYNGDSSIRFWWFMLIRRPVFLLLSPWFLLLLLLHAVKLVDRDHFKQAMYIVVEGLKTEILQARVDSFWSREKKKINSWVKSRISQEKKEGLKILCISASPRFLLDQISAELGIEILICTEMKTVENHQTRFMAGPNCRGQEKVRRLQDWADLQQVKYKVVRFCSDSQADLPLYQLAEEKYKVVKGILSPGLP